MVVELALAAQGAIIIGGSTAITNVVISRLDAIKRWWWRLFGHSSVRIVFKSVLKYREVNLMKFLADEAIKLRHGHTHFYEWSTKEGNSCTCYSILVPNRSFDLPDQPIHVLPLIGAGGEIIGYDFWTRGTFGSLKKYKDMINNLQFILDHGKTSTQVYVNESYKPLLKQQ